MLPFVLSLLIIIKESTFTREVWNYRRDDIDVLRQSLIGAPWDTAYQVSEDVDDLANYWSDRFLYTAKQHVPF